MGLPPFHRYSFFVVILLFSPSDDEITHRVSLLLKYVGADYLVITDEILSLSFRLGLKTDNQDALVIQGKRLSACDVKVIWYYRFLRCPRALYNRIAECTNQELASQMSLETTSLYSFLPRLFPLASIVGDVDRLTTNKLQELIEAEKAGLLIPDTFVISEKTSLLEIFGNYSNGIVVKSLYNAQVLYLKGGRFPMYVKLVHSRDLDRLPYRFFPSLVQERIVKKCDVRVFYLAGVCYGVCVSTEDMVDHVDFRKYGGIEKSRFTRYCLDPDLVDKIHEFMRRMGLAMGSLDFVLTPSNELVFLEVNNNGSLETLDNIYGFEITRAIVEHLCKLNYQ